MANQVIHNLTAELNANMIRYGQVTYGPVDITANTPFSINNPYANKTCVGALVMNSGGAQGFAHSTIMIVNDVIRLYPLVTDTQVIYHINILYLN